MDARITTALAALVALAFAGGAAAEAREFQASGDGAYVTLSEERVELDGGRTARHYRTAGFVTSDPQSPFDRTEQNCSGTEVTNAESTTAAGYCDGSDRDGDVWWIWWRGDRDGAVWGLLSGTGKFAGLKGGGSLRYVDRFPNGKFTIKWEGRWTAD